MVNPGQGTSRKARARRNRRDRDLSIKSRRTTTTTVSQPSRQTNNKTTNSRRRTPRMNINLGMSLQGSDYLRTLAEPEECRGCKIPDGTIFTGTSTWQSWSTRILQTNTNNLVGMWINPTLDGGIYTTLNPDGEMDAITWQAYTPVPGLLTARTIYKAHRVVSASLRVTYSGSTLADQGMLCGLKRYVPEREQEDGASAPPNANPNNAPSSFQDIMNDPQSETFPARNGILINYMPMGLESFELTPLADTQGEAEKSAVCFGFVGAQLDGTSTLLCTLCINYEALPIQGSGGIIPISKPAPKDESAMKFAYDWMSNLTGSVEPAMNKVGSKASQVLTDMAANVAVNQGKKLLYEQLSRKFV